MNRSQFEQLIREVIQETIRKVDGKYVVYPEKGGKRLGAHSTRKAAEKQLTAIHLNKEEEEKDWEKRDWELYEAVETDNVIIVLSVIDGKRNLDNDQISQLFSDDVAGTFYIYAVEEGEEEFHKPVSKQDAYKYIDYYNARLKKDYKREEKLGAELGVLGIESELHFHRGEFKTDPSVFSANENYADGKVKGKSRPGRVKKSGASCKGSVSDLRAKAKKYGGEKGKMYHWCANMKSGRKK